MAQSDREKLLRDVQTYGLVLYDTALFLDTHKDNIAALKYYDKMKIKFNEAKEKYTNKYGPLTMSDLKPDMNKWAWAEGPWPWEGDHYYVEIR